MKLWTKILCGLLLAFIPASRLSFAWTTPVNISNTIGDSRFASLAIDNLGHVHVVWEDNTSGNNEVLYCLFNKEYWSAPLNISNDLTDSEGADITIDTDGHPHVAWIDYQSGEILWTYYNGFSWSSPSNISNNPGHSTCPSLSADDSGQVFIVWHDISWQSDIYFSIFEGTAWSIPQNLTDDPVGSAYPDIAVGVNGHVHVVWMDYGDFDIHYSKYDGYMWTSPVNISQLNGQSCGPKITLDSHDHPHVIWEERSGGYHVYYTFYDAQVWFPSYKISSGHNPTIAHDSSDNSHAVWGSDYVIYHSFGSDTSWSIPLGISDSPEARCLCPNIVIDSEGCLYVVWTYRDEQNNPEIFYSSHYLTDVEEQLEGLFPQEYRLEQNYPNPFNPETVIRYSFAGNKPTHITLKVYNLLGEEVLTLIDGEQVPDDYEVIWNGRNKKGDDVSSGVYFCQLKVGSFMATRKMLVLR